MIPPRSKACQADEESPYVVILSPSLVILSEANGAQHDRIDFFSNPLQFRAREQPRDDTGEALPAPSLALELPPPHTGQRIEAGAAVVFR